MKPLGIILLLAAAYWLLQPSDDCRDAFAAARELDKLEEPDRQSVRATQASTQTR